MSKGLTRRRFFRISSMRGIGDAQNHRLVKVKSVTLVEQSNFRRGLNMSHQAVAVNEILHHRLLLNCLKGREL